VPSLGWDPSQPAVAGPHLPLVAASNSPSYTGANPLKGESSTLARSAASLDNEWMRNRDASRRFLLCGQEVTATGRSKEGHTGTNRWPEKSARRPFGAGQPLRSVTAAHRRISVSGGRGLLGGGLELGLGRCRVDLAVVERPRVGPHPDDHRVVVVG